MLAIGRWVVPAVVVALALSASLVLGQAGHEYSAAEVRSFVSDCTGAGLPSESCRCLAEEAEASVAYDDFTHEAQVIFRGGSSPDLQGAALGCGVIGRD